MNELPSISVVTPVYNSEKVLGSCLQSIREQDYPQDKIEIIVVDGGSTDKTLKIVREFEVDKILSNPLKTGEAGKAVGVKAARNEIIALIDSDNILPQKDWFLRMVQPFEDPEIIGSEPLYYTYRKEDGYITRYCALLGMNDPLCLFLGNYDRYSQLTSKWTEMPHKEEDKGNYLKIELDKKQLPTIGANGFLIRRSVLLSALASSLQPLTSSVSPSNPQPLTSDILFPDYLFDIDVIYELLNPINQANSTNPINVTNPIRFAKVKTGIIHIFSGDIKTFAQKQRRRVRDYLYYNKLGVRKYPWKSTNKAKLLRFILFCLTVFPLLIQSIKGYIKKPDRAWFFHPIACYLTLWEYGWGRINGIFGVKELRREGWMQ